MSPGVLDPDVVRRHLAALDRAVSHLRRHRGHPVERLLDDLDEQWAVERGLQLCAQSVLDVASHVCAAEGEASSDYASAIDGLASCGVLPRPFAARLRGVAGFRNILVHDYLDVDHHLVHRLLNERLDDFVEFARHLEAWLGEG